MPALIHSSQFASDVAEGFSARGYKRIAPRYFYDDLGSALFEAITLLPEYGLSRADERLLRAHSGEIATLVSPSCLVAELGSGSGRKTLNVLRALGERNTKISYCPIDVSAAALASCESEIGTICDVLPICEDWTKGLKQISACRAEIGALLLLFLGSSIGNLERSSVPEFLRQIRQQLKVGDFFLLGADLIKDKETMLAAYDDSIGVTAAFNLNVLGRMNRELGATFDLRSFAHEVRWNEEFRRIEMHLLSCRNQSVQIAALESTFEFEAGETIWTESSHKFTEAELQEFAMETGFLPIQTWLDQDWPFAETLWRAA